MKRHGVFIALLCCFVASAPARSDVIPEGLRDPEDGQLDASEVLEKGGFIPVPIIITEPAVEGGFGLAAAFLTPPKAGSDDEPTRSFLGYAETGNSSQLAFAARLGSLANGDLKYRVVAAAGSINLEFFPTSANRGLAFNNEALYGEVDLRHRLGDSRFFLGATATVLDTKVTPDFGEGLPLPPNLSADLTLNAIGLAGHYDSRDNILTPRNGLNANFGLQRYDDAVGSDANFTAIDLFAAYFHSPDPQWTYSGMVNVTGTDGDAPFFMEPSINIRGVPFNRYQGDRIFSAELEVRRQITPRWAVVGFAGYGRATSSGAPDISSDTDATGFGAGVRYRIARKFGLDMGIDIARGPEDTVIYIQFGHAWSFRMD